MMYAVGFEEPESRLILPVTYHEIDSEESDFPDSFCKALYYLRYRLRNMDIFAYANILFFIEKYTDTRQQDTPSHERPLI